MIRTTQAIAAVCAALALASCGKDSGSPIPQGRADRLDALLQQVQRQSDAGSCTTLLNTTIPALETQAKRLPSSVSSNTRETVTDGFAHLRDLAETDCAEKQQQQLPTTTDTTTESTPSTSTDTTPSTSTDTTPSTSTDTTPSTSTDTTPTTTDTTPPDNPPGNGGVTPGTPKQGGNKGNQTGGVQP
jgi:hypothetical protein